MSNLVKHSSSALSYPKLVIDALAEVRSQGFTCSHPEHRTCYERSQKQECYGKTGWVFKAQAVDGSRYPWDIWVFPEGTFDDEDAVPVEVEVLADDAGPDAPKTQIDLIIFDDIIPEAIDVVVSTPLALPESV